MQVLLKLYSMTKAAADGSTISRQVTDEYLAGDDYKQVIEDHLAMGGRTHKDRKVEDKYSDLVGQDDQILISDNITHYITKIYTEPNNDYCMAVVQILDPNDYAGQRKENIQNLIGDLSSGIKLPCSVVVQALWNYNNECEKIIRIKGVDMTLNPSFDGSGTVKVFSAIAPDLNKEGIKFYSKNSNKDYSNCVLKTVVFSSEAEVIEEKETLTPRQVADKYGLASRQYSFAKKEGYFSEDLFSAILHPRSDIITKVEELKSNENSIQNAIDESTKLERIHQILLQLIGDEETVDALISKSRDDLLKLYEDNSEQLRIALDHFLYDIPETHQFSTINAVRDRMLFQKLPRFSLIRRIFKAYQLYWQNNQTQLDDNQIEFLQLMFIQDVGILLRNVLKQIMQGNNLTTLYALVQFNPEIAASGKRFSKIYRQVMISEKILGFIPQQKYLSWKKAYIDFINACIQYVFGTELKIQVNSIDYITKM